MVNHRHFSPLDPICSMYGISPYISLHLAKIYGNLGKYSFRPMEHLGILTKTQPDVPLEVRING